MNINVRSNGDVALDWHPPADPFLTLTPEQHRELVRAIRAREGR